MNDTAKQDVFLCMNLGESVLQNSAEVSVTRHNKQLTSG